MTPAVWRIFNRRPFPHSSAAPRWLQRHRQLSAGVVTPAAVMDFIRAKWADVPGGSGLTCTEISPHHAIMQCRVPMHDIRPGGFISGPAQFALCDVAMWAAVFGAKGLDEMAMTSEMSIRFLRPALGDELTARVDTLSVGTRQIVMQAKVFTDNADKPTVLAQGTYVMPKG